MENILMDIARAITFYTVTLDIIIVAAPFVVLFLIEEMINKKRKNEILAEAKYLNKGENVNFDFD